MSKELIRVCNDCGCIVPCFLSKEFSLAQEAFRDNEGGIGHTVQHLDGVITIDGKKAHSRTGLTAKRNDGLSVLNIGSIFVYVLGHFGIEGDHEFLIVEAGKQRIKLSGTALFAEDVYHRSPWGGIGLELNTISTKSLATIRIPE
jgi:hypothetical protein